ncbi:hypothetical protein, partial [Pseudomonas sp. ICMP 460]|uniref:hypothetical protein n=1 Tax=Pseudomonas sp. ICMP 460 TaxID=1718917 RepID=UPI001C4572BD
HLPSRMWSNCGRGLAPDGGVSDKYFSTDTLQSGASPLPQKAQKAKKADLLCTQDPPLTCF